MEIRLNSASVAVEVEVEVETQLGNLAEKLERLGRVTIGLSLG